MMDVYIFQASLLCDDCGKESRAKLHPELLALADLDGNSDMAPQGPYANGGGEADCPQSCDLCGTFLRNALTTDGLNYVRERVADSDCTTRLAALEQGRIVLVEWSDYYDVPFPDGAGES